MKKNILKKMEDELKFNALHDSLTGLANRRLLAERMKASIEYCEREDKLLAVFMIDLDKFKAVNDTYGHNVGDDLLVEVGNRIKKHVNRKTDTVARVGGDEFAVIAPLINDENDAKLLANKICESLNETFVLAEIRIDISASVGIALFPPHAITRDDLMTKADYAVYDIKKQGGNGYKIFSK